MDCLLTKDFSEFSKHVDVLKIPGLSGDGFSVDLSVSTESLLFLIKKSTDFSVAEALLSESQFDKGTKVEDIYALRDIYANEKRHGDELTDNLGNNSYKTMVSCMDDKTMTGILIFYPAVTVSKKEYMGPKEITGALDYVLPFLQISNVSFHEDKADVSQGVSCGEIFLKEKPAGITDGHRNFSLTLEESFAAFRQGKLYMPQMVFGLALYSLFGQKAALNEVLLFLGSNIGMSDGSGQKTPAFEFRMVRGVRLSLPFKVMTGIVLNGGSAEVSTDNGWKKLKITFDGQMLFGKNDADYDYFSYDSLLFSDLKIDFSLSSGKAGMECHYRDIRLLEQGSRLREKSFLGTVPHGGLSFVSFQDAKTPDALGYRQIIAGCMQQAIKHGDWFGIVVPVELFHGVKLNLLLAFGQDIFYAGVSLSGKASVAVSSLIDMKWQEIQIQKNEGKYALGFRGLKASCFGKEFPEGSANLILVPGAGDNAFAWYALYDNRKGGE